MRQYNVVAVTRYNNPNIVNFFDKEAAAIQFNPNLGFNLIRKIYKDGTSIVERDIHVRKTYRYQTTLSAIRKYNCGDHALILTNNKNYVLDIDNDIISYF